MVYFLGGYCVTTTQYVRAEPAFCSNAPFDANAFRRFTCSWAAISTLRLERSIFWSLTNAKSAERHQHREKALLQNRGPGHCNVLTPALACSLGMRLHWHSQWVAAHEATEPARVSIRTLQCPVPMWPHTTSSHHDTVSSWETKRKLAVEKLLH